MTQPLPPTGGSWIRDPDTGALTQDPADTQRAVAAEAAEALAAQTEEPAPPADTRKGTK